MRRPPVLDDDDPALRGLRKIPALWAMFEQQPQLIQRAYVEWWNARTERRAAHRDCLEAFLGGYAAGHQSRRRPAA